jgi:hypothetical protein
MKKLTRYFLVSILMQKVATIDTNRRLRVNITEDEFIRMDNFYSFKIRVLFILMIPGIALNVLTSFIFMFRRRFWQDGNTMGFFFMLHPLFASMSLLALGVYIMIEYYNILTTNLCRFFYFITLFFVIGGLLFQLLITIDRYVSIVYPQKHTFFKKKRNLIGLTMVAFISAIPASTLMLFRRLEDRQFYFDNFTTKSESCIVDDTYNIHFWINFMNIIFRIVPMIIMFTLSIRICAKVIASKKKASAQTDRSMRRERKFTITLIFLNIVYFSSFFPDFVTNIWITFDASHLAKSINHYCRWFVFVNEACPFFINLLTNKLFKSELIQIFYINTRIISNRKLNAKQQSKLVRTKQIVNDDTNDETEL